MINKEKLFQLFKKINYGFEYEGDGQSYRYFHALRVLSLAQEIVEKEGLLNKVNQDLLWVLALFHDIGHNEELLSKEQIKANDKSKDLYDSQLFEQYVFPLIDNEKLVQELKVAVADFSQRRFEKIESRVVKDADDLDEIGLLNFWRLGVYAGKYHLNPQDSIDYFYQHDLSNKQQKLDKLFFDFSKKIAKQRIEEMLGLLDNFRDLNKLNI